MARKMTAEGGTGKSKEDADPLDAYSREGAINFLTGALYSPRFRELAERWRNLPVYKDVTNLRELQRSISEYQVTVVISGTGSGKTVIVPKLAVKHAINVAQARGQGTRRPLQVAVTNPKSSIALKNAEYAALTLDTIMGTGYVGANFRGAPSDSHLSGGDDALLFVTDGYLVAQSRSDPLFSRYGVIVIDEAHERTVSIDNLLFRLRKALDFREDLRVIIISATIDPKLFTDYFDKKRKSSVLSLPSPSGQSSVGDGYNRRTNAVEISGASYFPVDSVFLSPPPASKVNEGDMDGLMSSVGLQALRRAMMTGGPSEDILFFVPTSRDAENGCKMVASACAQGLLGDAEICEKTKCTTLYSKLSEERKDVARSLTVELPFDRKLIFATNLAESSLTLPTLTTVIDSGLELTNTWVPEMHAYRLQKAMSSRAQMTQRKGRVGRTRPGTCFHLYSEKRMLEQPLYPSPSILEVDITDDFLAMMREEGANFSTVCRDYSEYLTPPRPAQVAATASVLSFYRMIELFRFKKRGATDGDGGGDDAAGKEGVIAPHQKIGKEDVNEGRKKEQQAKEKGNDRVYVHYGEVDFECIARCDDLTGVADMYGGRITTLGKVTLDLMKRAKLGFWNALFLVGGFAYDCVSDSVILASILEECSGEPSMLWQESDDKPLTDSSALGSRPEDIIRDVLDLVGTYQSAPASSLLHARSEHLGLVAFYRAVSKIRRAVEDAAHAKRTASRNKEDHFRKIEAGRKLGRLLNQGLWDKIDFRTADTQAKMRDFQIRSMTSILEHSPLLSLSQSVAPTKLERCVLSARAYHVLVPESAIVLSPPVDEDASKGRGIADEKCESGKKVAPSDRSTFTKSSKYGVHQVEQEEGKKSKTQAALQRIVKIDTKGGGGWDVSFEPITPDDAKAIKKMSTLQTSGSRLTETISTNETTTASSAPLSKEMASLFTLSMSHGKIVQPLFMAPAGNVTWASSLVPLITLSSASRSNLFVRLECPSQPKTEPKEDSREKRMSIAVYDTALMSPSGSPGSSKQSLSKFKLITLYNYASLKTHMNI